MTQPASLQLRFAGHTFVVYSANWCPDCRRLKDHLARVQLPHTTVSIEHDEAAADRLVAETGKRAIPYILVDGKTWVRGYHKEHPDRLDPALLLAELTAATGSAAGAAEPPGLTCVDHPPPPVSG